MSRVCALLACSTSDGGIQHVGVCKGSQLLHCGQLHAAQLDAFRAQLATVMAKVAERKGDARAQVAGRQGHQKTPAMVRAAAVQALRQLAAEAAAEAEGREADSVPDQVPQDGFTDVGMHTGGGQRDTAWPVVREVLKVRVLLYGWVHGATVCSRLAWPAAMAGPAFLQETCHN